MTTDSYSFTHFIKAARDCSPILETKEIIAFLEAKNYEPLMLFMHRIAAFVANDVKNSNEFRNLDDSDFIDAAQECTADMQTVIGANPEKFSGYAAVTFRRRIRRYLAGVNNGGLGWHGSPAMRPISLIDPFYEDTDDDTAASQLRDVTEDVTVPIGLGDPLDELIRAETVELALDALRTPAVNSKQGTTQATLARDKRTQKEIGDTNG
jgi:hypothetical protein